MYCKYWWGYKRETEYTCFVTLISVNEEEGLMRYKIVNIVNIDGMQNISKLVKKCPHTWRYVHMSGH